MEKNQINPESFRIEKPFQGCASRLAQKGDEASIANIFCWRSKNKQQNKWEIKEGVVSTKQKKTYDRYKLLSFKHQKREKRVE